MATAALYDTILHSLKSMHEGEPGYLPFAELAKRLAQALKERGEVGWRTLDGNWLYHDRPDIHPDKLTKVLVLPND